MENCFSSLLNADFLNSEQQNVKAHPNSSNNILKNSEITRLIGGKASYFYKTHSYPTKIPPSRIIPYILNHSRPGEMVLDPFCGSGSVGVACAITGRRAILSDIGVLATHLSFNHNRAIDVEKFLNTGLSVVREAQQICNPYRLAFAKSEFNVITAVYSRPVICSRCGKESTYWKSSIQNDGVTVNSNQKCSHCGTSNVTILRDKNNLIPETVLLQDITTGERTIKQVTKRISELRTFEPDINLTNLAPKVRIDDQREMFIRSALHLERITELRDFYTDRNLAALCALYDSISRIVDVRLRSALMMAFTNTAWHGSKMRRYNSKGGHRPLSGTLYLPPIYSEGNVFEIFSKKILDLANYYKIANQILGKSMIKIQNGSATNLNFIESGSVNFVFTDPPFGGNIFYSDCNFIAESWLGRLTETKLEAVVNKSLKESSGGKTEDRYLFLMKEAFLEIERVLHKSGEACVVFNHSDGKIWSGLHDALNDSGFELHGIDDLHKGQLSVKGYKAKQGEKVATKDLILILKKKKAKSKEKRDKQQNAIDIETFIRSELQIFLEQHSKVQWSDVAGEFYPHIIRKLSLQGHSTLRVSLTKVKDLFSEHEWQFRTDKRFDSNLSSQKIAG